MDSGPRARQLVATARVGGRHVDVERAQQSAPRVLDLVAIAVLDEQQRARPQRHAPALHQRGAGARHDVEPLVGAAVTVGRPALGLARRQHHLGYLGAAIAQRDAKTLAKAKTLAFHDLSIPGVRAAMATRRSVAPAGTASS